MTTQTIETTIGSTPNPSNWLSAHTHDEPPVMFLEKATDGRTTIEDIKPALDEYKRLYKAGIASPSEMLTLSRAYPENELYSKAIKKMGIGDDDSLVIGGPASIEMVDREGHLITTESLTKAFKKYMANFRTRNAMVLHSDVQVGWALPAYISKGGQIFKSGVDDKGLFFITELRNDTKISKKVAEQIHDGKLKSYSIAGSAIKTQTVQKGLREIMQVDELELAEVTVCEKGVNQGASFDILKATDAATSSCIDGSCLIQKEEECDCGCNTIQGVDFMYKSDGDIDFTKSFLNFVGKPINKIVQDDDGEYGESFPALVDIQGRQEKHRKLLDERGFPPGLETNDTKRATIEGGNSAELPLVVFKGILSKAKEEKELQKVIPWAVPAAAALGGFLGSKKSNKEAAMKIKNKPEEDPQEIQKISPVVAGLAGMAAGKILSSNKEASRNVKEKEDAKEIQKIGPLAAGLLGVGAAKILGSNKEASRKIKNKNITKEQEIQKFPLGAAAAGFAEEKILGSHKESSRKIKNKPDEASQELQKIGPLAAGLLAYGAGKILSSNKESARKTKNKTITKAHEFVGWVQKSDPMTRVPHLLKENCPCESCFQKNSDFKGTIEREVNNYFA